MKSSVLALTILAVLSLVTHFLFLGRPNAAVFDEVYYGNYAKNYTTEKFFFDNHPPLGKMTMALAGKTFDLFGGVDYKDIGDPLPASFVKLRVLPILAGVLLPLVLFGICRVIGMSVLASFFVGFLMIFENSLVVQSRFMLLDSQLLLYGFVALLLYLVARKYRDGTAMEKASPHATRVYWTLFCLSAVFAGMTAAVKWSGLSFAGFIGLIELTNAWQMVAPSKIKIFAREIWKWKTWLRWIGYAAIVLATYTLILTIHLSILSLNGTDNDNAYMSQEFQKTLVGNKYAADPQVQGESFVGKFLELNSAYYRYQASITQGHPYSSPWYSWPVMYRTIYYWLGADGGMIYFFGNPVVYWLGFLAMIALVFMLILGKIWKKLESQQLRTGGFLLTGYVVNFLPFIFIHRPMFLYHYMVALVFAIMTLAWIFDQFRAKVKVRSMVSVMVLVVLVFVYFSPLTYGYTMGKGKVESRFWFSTWR